ncbi:hypothetical protein FH972_024670 [Carpinus fangiana]|uniref:Enoyl reductase (ER) domain-containing protein n=1 Tax=Carpinus fangiana TaxID=176857 RepID=A0A5N6KYN5_9ROSI|nr:hypothetical protein FH972_024670 [Carpinus fangiana]
MALSSFSPPHFWKQELSERRSAFTPAIGLCSVVSGACDSMQQRKPFLQLAVDNPVPFHDHLQTKGKITAMSIPKTCKAQVFEKAGAGLVLKDVPVNEPQAGEILIKSIACGVCHSDSAVGAGLMGDVLPRIPGHEVIGDVVAVGPGEKKQCNKGLFQMCANEAINGVSRDGGYSEYVTLRSEAAVTIPKDLDPYETAPLLCAGVTLFNSVRKMDIERGDIVAVQGLGGLGHLGLQYVRKMGYRTVALSSSDAKKDFAFKLGATDYIDGSKEDHGEALAKMGGASLIVVTAPNPKIISSLLNGLGAGGKLLILAPVGELPINSVTMILKGLSVHGWPSGHALDSEEAISFAQIQGVNCMIEKFPLDKANEALKHMEEGKVRFRGVLTF